MDGVLKLWGRSGTSAVAVFDASKFTPSSRLDDKQEAKELSKTSKKSEASGGGGASNSASSSSASKSAGRVISAWADDLCERCFFLLLFPPPHHQIQPCKSLFLTAYGQRVETGRWKSGEEQRASLFVSYEATKKRSRRWRGSVLVIAQTVGCSRALSLQRVVETRLFEYGTIVPRNHSVFSSVATLTRYLH